MNKETIEVKYVNDGKWGKSILVGETWYNLDKKSGLTGDEFVKGQTYTVLVSESKTGKKYIAQIVSDVPAVEVKEEPKVKAGDDKMLEVLKEKSNKTPPLKLTTYPQRDFDAEARGKIACALRAALYASPAVAMYCTSWDEYLKKVDAEVARGSEEVLKAQRG